MCIERNRVTTQKQCSFVSAARLELPRVGGSSRGVVKMLCLGYCSLGILCVMLTGGVCEGPRVGGWVGGEATTCKPS